MKLILPTFLIIGAQKAASTAFYFQLKTHDDVFFSDKKELHFFTLDYNYRRGLEYYSGFFQNWNGEKAIGEATPKYLYEASVPERIHACLPDVKLIISLRDPIDRAYSTYIMQRTKGSEPPWTSFEEAVQKSPQYLEYGRYYKQLQRYFRFFSEDQIHIILYEDLKENPQDVYDNICDFLKIRRFQLNNKNISRPNVGGMPKNIVVSTMLNQLYASRNYLRKTFASVLVNNRFVDTHSRKIRNRISSWNKVRDRYPKLSHDVRQRLLPLVQNDNNKLSQLIKRDLSKWND